MNAVARFILVTAGLLLALGIVLGAAGSHALRARLTPAELNTFEIGVRYHLYNALGLLAMGVLAVSVNPPLLRWAAVLVVAGVVLFSGSLYVASFGAPRFVHMLPPFGGLAMIGGWLLFAVALWRTR